MNQQYTSYGMMSKEFDKLLAVHTQPTPRGKLYLNLRKLMYVIMVLGFVVPFVAFWIGGMKDIGMLCLCALLFGVVIAIIPFVMTSFFRYASIHRTKFYMSPIMNPVVHLTEDGFELLYGDIRDVDWHPSRLAVCAVNYQDMREVTVNPKTKLVELKGPYTFTMYKTTARTQVEDMPERDVFATRGAVSFFDAMADSKEFFAELERRNIPVKIVEE